MINNLRNLHYFRPIFTIAFLCFLSPIYAQQGEIILNSEFLDGLPPDVADLLEENNEATKEARENEELFRFDTSLESQKIILENLQLQVDELRSRLGTNEDRDKLPIFGSNFFSSIQTTFSPYDLPNIDENYILGPGDKLEITILSSETETLKLRVEKDGTVIIPQYGKIFISGESLKSANELISKFISQKSLGSEVFLTLVELKDIKVVVLGYVKNPGVYTLSANSNYLHALNVAGGINQNGSYRSVTHSRSDRVLLEFDLYDTFVNGKTDYFNFIRSGDIIFVNPKNYTVAITGGVNFQGIFEMKDGESLGDLIQFAGGTSQDFAGYKQVNIKRINEATTRKLSTPIDSVSGFLLQPRDSVIVPLLITTPDEVKTVVVRGEVVNPGEYTVRDGETLSNVIKRAGGYKSNAYVLGGALFRENVLNKEYGYAQKNYEETINFIVSSLGTPNTSIDASVVSLLSEELKSKTFSGRIITEFNLDLISKNNYLDVDLQDKDEIYIPSLSKVVYVFGEFNNPSTVIFDPTKNLSDYLSLSGGVKKTAIKELIIVDPDGKTQIYKLNAIFPQNIELYPGSIIYAPRDIGRLKGVNYAATVSPILSSLALTLASLNSIND